MKCNLFTAPCHSKISPCFIPKDLELGKPKQQPAASSHSARVVPSLVTVASSSGAQANGQQPGGDKSPTVCPRCSSTDTKFCYNNNKKASQPRYRCNSCKRKFTKGGKIRFVPPKKSDRQRHSSRSGKDGGFPFLVSKIAKARSARRERMRRKQVTPCYKEERFDLSEENDESEEQEGSGSDEKPRKRKQRGDESTPPACPHNSSSSSSSDDDNKSQEPEQKLRIVEVTASNIAAAAAAPAAAENGGASTSMGTNPPWSFKIAFEKIKKAIQDGYAGIVYA